MWALYCYICNSIGSFTKTAKYNELKQVFLPTQSAVVYPFYMHWEHLGGVHTVKILVDISVNCLNLIIRTLSRGGYARKSGPQDHTDWSTDYMPYGTYCVIVPRVVLIKYKHL